MGDDVKCANFKYNLTLEVYSKSSLFLKSFAQNKIIEFCLLICKLFINSV
nr:MAG TPA: hypothetical protein [Caudoviricetes sp.]